MPASNTVECFEHFIGRTVEGVLIDEDDGSKTLVFDNGEGLHLSCNGTFWIVQKDDVEKAIRQRKLELERTQKRLAGVLKLAGAKP